jgi:hypothetical protein
MFVKFLKVDQTKNNAAAIGWPRALKNGVNKERPLQIGLPPNYLERVYIEIYIKVNASLKTHGLFV